MTETLQDKIDAISHYDDSNYEYYVSTDKVNKAIQELREAVLLTLIEDGVNSYTINSILALIGEKK